MKPRSFKYVRAHSLDEVLAVLDEHGDDAKVLAGGQSLLPVMNTRLAAPDVLVDAGDVEEMRGIALDAGVLRIGAMTRHAELAASADVAKHAPLISQAIPHIGHPAIRNRGTLGGSLCHADPAAELPACAVALGASFNVAGSAARRSVEAAAFFKGMFATSLAPNEVVVSVDIPVAGPGSRTYFGELVRRKGDYAMVGLAAQTGIGGDRLSDPRLVFFAVAEGPEEAKTAAALLDGQTLGAVDAEAVCDALAEDIEPLADLTTSAEAKAHMMKVLTREALASLAGGEG